MAKIELNYSETIPFQSEIKCKAGEHSHTHGQGCYAKKCRASPPDHANRSCVNGVRRTLFWAGGTDPVHVHLLFGSRVNCVGMMVMML